MRYKDYANAPQCYVMCTLHILLFCTDVTCSDNTVLIFSSIVYLGNR